MYAIQKAMVYHDSGSYRQALEARGALPEGFLLTTGRLDFVPVEKPWSHPLPMKLSVLLLDEATPSFAGAFTRNAFPGAPVILGRHLLDQPLSRGVMVNTKVANVGAPGGLEAALRLQKNVASLAGCPPDQLFVLSTGVIGWGLPVEAMEGAIPTLWKGLHRGNLLSLAEAIMTTDSYPKVRSVALGSGTLSGVAKGAGMIEPNLATMIGLIATDVTVEREVLRRVFAKAVSETFNAISVDGDQSTSDTVLAFSSNRKPPVAEEELLSAMIEICGCLAADVVRNGEGTSHVLEVEVTGAPDKATALGCARAVANSPLVKTAVYGNDPNVGRILSAAGSWLGKNGVGIDTSLLTLDIGGLRVFHSGRFELRGETEKELSGYMRDTAMAEKRDFPPHEKSVHFRIHLGLGVASATVLGSDLSHEYISVNADYRS